MIWIDYAFIGLVALSLVVGLIRGFMREIISLITWIAAFWLSVRFHLLVGEHLGTLITSQWALTAFSFSIVFFLVLLLGMLINYVMGVVVKVSKARMTDRIAGAIFGVIRGVVIVLALVTAFSLTPLTESDWWHQSRIIAYSQPVIARVRAWMPVQADSAAFLFESGGLLHLRAAPGMTGQSRLIL